MEGGIRRSRCRSAILAKHPGELTIASRRRPRYAVGIDLGTTHTVVAYADTRVKTDAAITVFDIEQLIAPGEVTTRPLLPSLRYHPAPGELAPDDVRLPWPDVELEGDAPLAVIGELARELGAKVPGRLVTSAKSWLSHPAVERTAAILPWGAAPDVQRVSPLVASASYLAHIRAAWNTRFPRNPLEKQDIVLTVPASFDDGARALTVQAARLAKLDDVRLLEEPQAACYDWMHRHRDDMAAALKEARLLLVCDVGGGTTDLTLIRVESAPSGPRLTRIGVGDHLMLGGDNMDLALAHVVERRLQHDQTALGAAALTQLVQQCRRAKERLLGPNAPAKTTVTLLGGGARMIGGSQSAELGLDEVLSLVLDGFFPNTDADQRPQRGRTALKEFGLPYAADPGITRHLAEFLAQHAQADRAALGDQPATDCAPDTVLLNGGVFRSTRISQRLLEVLHRWRGAPPRLLQNQDPDVAVARGAVAYTIARRSKGFKIGGGSARSYYLLLGAEGADKQGVCLLPRGTEEAREVRLRERTFSLRLGQPVRFHLVSSTADAPHRPGDIIPVDTSNFIPLPTVATVLDAASQAGDTPEVRVQLAAELTEVGTLAIDCVSIDDAKRRWNLEFMLRNEGAGPIAPPETKAHPRIDEGIERIERIYGSRVRDVMPKEVKRLRADLEKTLGRRDSWNTALLRELFATLWEGARRRRRSADHERLWFNLAGFCLRPGFGYPLDEWRIEQLWSCYGQGVQHAKDSQVWSEWWTLWRRVAGGLDADAQAAILHDLAPVLRPTAAISRQRTGRTVPGYADIVRLVAALEKLPAERKTDVGDWLLTRLSGKGESPQTWWAIGRLGARVPFYGSAHTVIPREAASKWLESVLALDWKTVHPAAFAATLLSRMSGDRERDLDASLREQVLERLRSVAAAESWIRMVEQVTELDAEDEQRVFGESLPPGLRLVS